MFTHPRSKHWKESLVEIESENGGWTRHFKDPKTDQEWTEYYPYEDDRSPSFMRHRNLPQDLETLLSQCLESTEKDEWIGVAAHVSGAFQPVRVAEVLGGIAPKLKKKALKIFGKYYQAYDKRDIIGMHHTEVGRSYEEYLSSVRRINILTYKKG